MNDTHAEIYIVTLHALRVVYCIFYMFKRTEEDDFQLALQLSKSLMENDTSVLQPSSQLHDTSTTMDQSNVVSEEDEMQKAIAMSLEG